MLTARTETEDRVMGLEIGADDYLPKPFDPRELLLRLVNVLRRSDGKRGSAADVPKSVRFGAFGFDLERGELHRDGELRPHHRSRARDAHRARRRRKGRPFPRETLAGGGDQLAADRSVDVQINRLRRKIESDLANPRWLMTVRGQGYRWRSSHDPLVGVVERDHAGPEVARAGARDAAIFVAGAAKAFVIDRWPLRQVRKGARAANQGLSKVLSAIMPKGLYVRALVIVIAPMVLLQSILAYVFMERHWQTVTERLSAALSQDIAALVDLDDALGPGKHEVIERIAAARLNLDVEFMPPTPLPAPAPKPFFQFFDEALAKEIRRHIHRPYWVDTIGRSNLVEIRVQLDDATLRVVAHRSQAYASNSGIFLAWMAGSSLFLLTIAVLFLRNQIRPILRLADAAESFGKGRDIEFRPRGAREVRKAGHAFIEMKRRLERMIDQRTTMLAGVEP